MKACILIVIIALLTPTRADWRGYRGPDGTGVSDGPAVPLEWGDNKNLKWKLKLPGAGSSSPIVLGKRVFVTVFSGVGEDGGSVDQLKRHLVCVDLESGKENWKVTVDAIQPEDPYDGFLPEHGYASQTPVTDGKHVYAFFGKSGVFCFDLDGKEIWKQSVGTGSAPKRWGSAASPILWKELIIINAGDESSAMIGLDKATGKEIWREKSKALEGAYGTPIIVPNESSSHGVPSQLLEGQLGREDLVLAVPGELWGLNPETGKLLWYAVHDLPGNISTSPVYANGIVYGSGGYPTTGRFGVKIGEAKGKLPDERILFEESRASYVPSPVVHEGHLYWVNDKGYASCAKLVTGEMVYYERVMESRSSGARGKPFYASVVLVDGKLIAVSRRSGAFVLEAKPEFKVLQHNTFKSDESQFNGSPAVSDGKLLLRSDQFLYCIGE